ncbi:MAG: hypothetical protein ACYS3N_11130 [Planctomycetota bacterium]|jgi:hypothetical protein
MGPLFVIIFWVIILIPIGFIIGAFLFFGGIPFIYWILKVPKEKRRIGLLWRFLLTIIFPVIFVPTMCVVGIYLMEKDTDDYWKSKGAWDYWRMPLEEPYELSMVDTMDDASIGKWKNGRSIVWGISKYEKRGTLVAGFCEKKQFRGKQNKWFIFDCTSGSIEEFKSEEEFHQACETHGFSQPVNMKTIKENWALYWKDPNRRKE